MSSRTHAHSYSRTGFYAAAVVLALAVLSIGTAAAVHAQVPGAPTVVSVSPASGATNVAPNATISVTFSEPMNASTLSGALVLYRGFGAVGGSTTYNPSTFVLTFTPSGPLVAGATYSAFLRGSARDLDGNAAPFTYWSFTTGDGSVPTNPTPTPTPSPAPAPTPAPSPPTSGLTPSGPMVLDGRNGDTVENLKISSSSGTCLIIRNSQNITVRNSEIGPCAGNAIVIQGSSGVNVVDSYIHPERSGNGCNPCDIGDSIYSSLSNNLLIQGNVIAFGESNVQLLGVSDSRVIGNFLLNPLGPAPRGLQVQVWAYGNTRSANVRVEDNYMLASRDPKYAIQERQTEGVNVGYTDGAVVSGNYITGGQYVSGCGIIADYSANSMQFLNNTIIETGECGIGVSSGTNQIVDGNRVYSHGLNMPNVGNTAIYVWQQGWAFCGPVQISNNVSVLIRPDGSLSSFWKGSGCNTTTLSGNTWDQAAIDALTPIASKYPPPSSIPPKPYATKVTSPYTQ